MSATWQSDTAPPDVRLSKAGVVRGLARAIPLAGVVFGGLLVMLLMRLIERPVFGQARPVTPYLTVFVCRTALAILGLRLSVSGLPLAGQGAVVANHSSWLDIFVLNASKRIYFVSKSEVARWPGIGWLARATGTVFIERSRHRAAEQTEVFRQRLNAGHRLLFFPEGTSSDGTRVLPFKSSLFAPFFDDAFKNKLVIQPVSVRYTAPSGQDPRFFGWWGDMDFASHLMRVLALGAGGRVDVVYSPPLTLTDFRGRKDLAKACEDTVRAGWSAPPAALG